jgi:hypothetical protein
LRREVVALESLTTRQGRELEEIEDELERVRREATARGSATTRPELQTVEAIQEEPVFTPMTIRPELTNRDEIIQALIREYPSLLRDEGVGGRWWSGFLFRRLAKSLPPEFPRPLVTGSWTPPPWRSRPSTTSRPR